MGPFKPIMLSTCVNCGRNGPDIPTRSPYCSDCLRRVERRAEQAGVPVARLAAYSCGGLLGWGGTEDCPPEGVDSSGELVEVLPGSGGKLSEDWPRSLIK